MEDIIICQGVLAHICVHATEATLVTGGQTQQHQWNNENTNCTVGRDHAYDEILFCPQLQHTHQRASKVSYFD